MSALPTRVIAPPPLELSAEVAAVRRAGARVEVEAWLGESTYRAVAVSGPAVARETVAGTYADAWRRAVELGHLAVRLRAFTRAAEARGVKVRVRADELGRYDVAITSRPTSANTIVLREVVTDYGAAVSRVEALLGAVVGPVRPVVRS